VNEVLRKSEKDPLSRMEDEALGNADPLKHSCRTFVVAISETDVGGQPNLFRSYHVDVPGGRAARCTIVNAALATCAAPTFFAPASFSLSEEMPPTTYGKQYWSFLRAALHSCLPVVDAAVGYANPAQGALHEASLIWKDGELGCLVSIGSTYLSWIFQSEDSFTAIVWWQLAGEKDNRAIGAGCTPLHYKWDLAKALVALSTNASRVDDSVSRALADETYARFNVQDRRMGRVGLGEYREEQIKIITGVTETWMKKHETSKKAEACVQRILRFAIESINPLSI
jgi:hypothetical protein